MFCTWLNCRPGKVSNTWFWFSPMNKVQAERPGRGCDLWIPVSCSITGRSAKAWTWANSKTSITSNFLLYLKRKQLKYYIWCVCQSTAHDGNDTFSAAVVHDGAVEQQQTDQTPTKCSVNHTSKHFSDWTEASLKLTMNPHNSTSVFLISCCLSRICGVKKHLETFKLYLKMFYLKVFQSKWIFRI